MVRKGSEKSERGTECRGSSAQFKIHFPLCLAQAWLSSLRKANLVNSHTCACIKVGQRAPSPILVTTHIFVWHTTGKIRKGDTIVDPMTRKKVRRPSVICRLLSLMCTCALFQVRVPRLVRMHANEMSDVAEASAGESVSVCVSPSELVSVRCRRLSRHSSA